ncbi:M48 family metallopeptidase [Teredinibacter waterburyi]|jgi:Predicted metal-dependent hydrolase|uniref:M48 family metallopeptidase n=1 Tax=Teredinibacter waterburyi TaxID=1500538 RepID=UPI00165F4017|nr:SprT family zinc-dependent metalloprotease [Teredinibacter waterburyi]
MPTRRQVTSQLRIADLDVTLTRKRMKYLRLRVSPPDGKVTVSAPHQASLREVKQMVTERLDWIAQQQNEIAQRPLVAAPVFSEGEQHTVWGKDLPLATGITSGRRIVSNDGDTRLLMLSRKHDSLEQKQLLIDRFYQSQIAAEIPGLIKKWEPIIERQVNEWGVRKMKTRWGSCNMQRSRIWLNSELARYPKPCLEYVWVHEMTHLHEASHNQRFYRLMTQFLPNWQQWESILRGR